ncbi:MAG: DUF3891 family protein, partial [Planctomycetota bacterium]
MIRREFSLVGGRSGWLLVSQVRHAHVSGDLASRCALDLGVEAGVRSQTEQARALIDLRQRLIVTIRHHDDGWAAWESAPQIDPEQGRPRSFVEMPLDDSLAIWSESIALAERRG